MKTLVLSAVIGFVAASNGWAQGRLISRKEALAVFGGGTTPERELRKRVEALERASQNRPATAAELARVGIFVGGSPIAFKKATGTQAVHPFVPAPPLKHDPEVEKRVAEFQKQRAAEGSEDAAYELGKRYLEGNGVEKDPAQARKYLSQAADAGHSEAKRLFLSLPSR